MEEAGEPGLQCSQLTGRHDLLYLKNRFRESTANCYAYFEVEMYHMRFIDIVTNRAAPGA
jgi:hypothetical protein